MNLNNLPKDMLIELVSQIQESKEEEYSEYVVIPYDKQIPTKYFTNEKDLKIFLLEYLVYNDYFFPSREYSEKFRGMTYKECKKFIDSSLLEKYSKENLFEFVEKIGEKNNYLALKIIKGKTISHVKNLYVKID